MWNEADFKKATGVSLEANTEQLEAAFIKLTKRSAHTETGRALLARRMMEREWSGSEAAAAMGISRSTVSRLASRGRVLWLCGPGDVELLWLAIEALGYGDVLVSLADTLEQMSPADLPARRAYVLRTMKVKVISARLGDNATPERIDALADHVTANGHTSPLAVAGALAAAAEALEIPLPARGKRQPKAGGDAPTSGKAKSALEAFSADRANADGPAQYSKAEVDDAMAIMLRAARILVESGMTPYQVADALAAHLDEVAAIRA